MFTRIKLMAVSGLLAGAALLSGACVAQAQDGAAQVFLPLITATATATQTGAYTSTYTVDGTTATSTGDTFTTGNTDESAVYVKNGGALTLTNATISTTGNTSSNDNSSFYGLNAGVLVDSGGSLTMEGGTVTTTGSGANGVVSSGSGTSVSIADVTINATGGGGHAVMATQGGAMTVKNVTMTTAGANSGAIATDRGGGTIDVTGGVVTTSGQDSPGIYSTGAIAVADAQVSASGAEAAVIEGANSITLTDTTLTTSLADKWGVMIYQSMSGDAEGTEGAFTMTGGKLADTAATGPLFYVTNSTGVITLHGVDAQAGSGVLVKAAAGSWGNSGANGGNVQLTADAQTLTGDLQADSISTLDVTLQNSSTLTGAINGDNTAKSVTLSLDASSQWVVTGDSHLTCLNDAAGISGSNVTNIVGNGHTVTYDSSQCPALNGQTYTLQGGGTLTPAS